MCSGERPSNHRRHEFQKHSTVQTYKRGIYTLLAFPIRFEHTSCLSKILELEVSIPLARAVSIHSSPRKGISPTPLPTHPVLAISFDSSRQLHSSKISQTCRYAYACTQKTVYYRTEMHMPPQTSFPHC